MSDVTRILNALERGDSMAVDRLLPVVYRELRLLAAQKLSREIPGQTLQATALVHEAYLRLVGSEDQHFSNRIHFFGAAAEAMRRILVENARRKKALKHGGNQQRVALDSTDLAVAGISENVIALDEALVKLAQKKPRIVEVVKLRYFAGLTHDQIADMLEISPRTVDSYWAYARAWLYNEIAEPDVPGQ
jgi:RNA polymerase sigma factor (TIGR02999 family)